MWKPKGNYLLNKIEINFKLRKVAQNLPIMQETRVQSLCWEDSLEKGRATLPSILAWRIPMDRGAWLATQSMGWQRVRPNRATNTSRKKKLKKCNKEIKTVTQSLSFNRGKKYQG